jgi:hypothetical protein
MARLERTQPPRDSWRVELVDQKSESGLVLFEYAMRAPGHDPFLLNNHRAQLRETHQRIVRGPNGGLMHVSGVEVVDLDTFKQGTEFYRWAAKDRSGNWRDDRGRTLTPFMFPTAPWAEGGDEELDPQWQRETYTIPIAEQVSEAIDRYSNRAEHRALVGDRRGTTLNLQVGASADDAEQVTSGDAVSIADPTMGSDATTEHVGTRFQNVTIVNASTIDDAIYSVTPASTGLDEPQHRVRGQAADTTLAFTTVSNNIDARARTTASIQWNSTDLGWSSGFAEWGAAAGSLGVGATIETIIQEIVNRAGWVSGNSMVLIWEQHTLDAARDLFIEAYDSSSALAAKLDIDYTGAGPAASRVTFPNRALRVWPARR